MKKITLVGDIMCEPLLLKASKRNDYSFNFDHVFENMKEMFTEADYVIGNLETPLAGQQAGYSTGLFEFNTPDEFADAIKDAGISFVSTANNHCMDRGYDGMIRTLNVLNEKGIPHYGTFLTPDERGNAYYFRLDDQKIALITYTYGANYSMHKRALTDEQEKTINLLHAYTQPIFLSNSNTKKSLAKKVFNRMLHLLKREHQAWIKKKLGMTYNVPRTDDYIDEVEAKPYLEQMKQDLRVAREQADIVIFYPHVGGQFNINPGRFTNYVFEKALACKCDAIIASHPHIVQKAEYKSETPCFYSIGNFSMSPNSVYLLHEHLPEYGLAVHLYIDRGKVVKTTFSVLRIVETKSEPLTVYPVDVYLTKVSNEFERRMLLQDVRQIYQTVVGSSQENLPIKREYTLTSGGGSF